MQMSARDRFLDTNVLLYLLSADQKKADRAESEVAIGGVISVQVLNEFASVARRKLRMAYADIREVLFAVRANCSVVPVTEETHDLGLQIADRHGLAVHDSMIVASALLAGCTRLLSEDLHDGQDIEGRLTIRNPFR
jgi:predicted nucleic acid-binding protein